MAYSGLGTGTEGDPYQVATAAQLNEVRDYLSAYFIQTADIDLSGYANWVPIDNFTGYYNGNGYKVSNMTITGTTYAGLFAYISGTVQKLGIENGSITLPSGYHYAGLLTSYAVGAVISECYTQGQIIMTAGGYCGGFSSVIDSSTISDCYTNCAISAIIDIGGGQGSLSYSIVNSTVSNCYGIGSLLALVAGYGFTYWRSGSTITNCYFDTQTTEKSTAVGAGVDTGMTGRTTAEMIYPTSLEYTDWDFTTIWRYDRTVAGVNDNYPMLRWQEYPVPTYSVDRQFKVKMFKKFFKFEKNNYFDAVNIKCYVVEEEIPTDID
jgi:hypothetical protein